MISKNKKISNFKNYNKKSVSNILKLQYIIRIHYIQVSIHI